MIARMVRLVLLLNVFYTFSAMGNNLTLVWEKASEFIDLIDEVGKALMPFMVFLFLYLFMFFLAFYMFGQQQVYFDYYYKIN